PEIQARLRRDAYACIHAVEEAAFPAVALAPRYGIPVIYDMQSSLPEQMLSRPGFRNRGARTALRACEAWLLERADYVVTSAGLVDHVRVVNPQADVRQWRYSSSPASASQVEIARVRETLGIPPGSRIVVYSGSFAPYQGLRELLGAMRHVLRQRPGTVFILVGAEGPGGATISDRAWDLIRTGSVHLLHRLPRESVAPYLGVADVLVSPRIHGGNLPLKIFDYLATGRPIVATDIHAHRAVLDPSRSELVEPSAEGIAAGILRLLSDAEHAARLAASAREYASQHLGWLAFVQSVGELYGEACSNPFPTE
nr:glycosyltransferase [Gemmatimonadota bacterium]